MNAWAGQAQWCVLDTGLGAGLNFLATWQAWKDDPQRPRMLHYCAIAQPAPSIDALPAELAEQWFGFTPGFHRISLEGGNLLLTMCIGERRDILRELDFSADLVFHSGEKVDELKAVARLCRRGAQLAGDVPVSALAQCGFAPLQAHAVFEPQWQPRGLRHASQVATGECVVIGGGLSGAAAAASLARRGWRVRVLDAAVQAASGASSLPAGLLAPHVSPDDSLLSRLSRAGVRMTLQQAAHLLQEGADWQLSGALEHREEADRMQPAAASAAHLQWSRPADVTQKHAAQLEENADAMWHAKAAWIKPASLVRAWLAQPGIQWMGGVHVTRIIPAGGMWCVMGGDGQEMARAGLIVVAVAHASSALLPRALTLQPVRGQVSWGPHGQDLRLPPFPINGNGHFIPRVPMPGGDAWLTGSTFVRDDESLGPRDEEQAANLERLRALAPAIADKLAPQFEHGHAQAWTGVRCASADRRPLSGEVLQGLWVSTAMGSRGLTFAVLCAELIAARIHGEPLPLSRKFAAALDVRRQLGA